MSGQATWQFPIMRNAGTGRYYLDTDGTNNAVIWKTAQPGPSNAGWTTAILRSSDPSQAEGSRPADGSLPRTAFLTATRKGIGATMNP